MKTLSPQQELQSRIAFLKTKKSQDLMILQNQYFSTVESLKPINILRSATYEFMAASNLKSKVLNGLIGFGKQYLTNNVFSYTSSSPVKRILGNIVKFGVRNFITKK